MIRTAARLGAPNTSSPCAPWPDGSQVTALHSSTVPPSALLLRAGLRQIVKRPADPADPDAGAPAGEPISDADRLATAIAFEWHEGRERPDHLRSARAGPHHLDPAEPPALTPAQSATEAKARVMWQPSSTRFFSASF